MAGPSRRLNISWILSHLPVDSPLRPAAKVGQLAPLRVSNGPVLRERSVAPAFSDTATPGQGLIVPKKLGTASITLHAVTAGRAVFSAYEPSPFVIGPPPSSLPSESLLGDTSGRFWTASKSSSPSPWGAFSPPLTREPQRRDQRDYFHFHDP